MSYSITVRQASILATATSRYVETMDRVRKSAGVPVGTYFDFGDANLFVSKYLLSDAPNNGVDGDAVLPDGEVVYYDIFYTDAMIVKYFTELEWHCISGPKGDEETASEMLTTDAREARRLFAFWVSQFTW